MDKEKLDHILNRHKLWLESAGLKGEKADFNGADFNGADLSGAHLSGANLSWANLDWTDFSRAHLSGADLLRANLIWANLSWTNLSKADIEYSKLGGSIFGDVDLSETLGLDTIHHFGPSTIGIDTIVKSKGKIPDVFLRGCGVPDLWIEHIHLLSSNAFEFYSCFISYTEADDEFSKQIYKGLQDEGVRCWRWREDAEWGKSREKVIQGAVRDYEKLIVILSKDSLKSLPVLAEIERALEKEISEYRKGGESDVLFPITIDNEIFDSNHEYKARLTSKFIGDFRKWKEPDEYTKSFQRLLKNLKGSKT